MQQRTEEELIDHIFANSFYDEETGCYLWQGCVAGEGYGVTCWESKQVYIHRIIYQFDNPNEIINVIRHTCDTPNCWCPDHLRNGTTQDNVNDKVLKGRHIFGSANYNARFTENDIRIIRGSELNIYQLAKAYDVTPSNIHYIRTYKTWRHVT
jgi:hypothetical protein